MNQSAAHVSIQSLILLAATVSCFSAILLIFLLTKGQFINQLPDLSRRLLIYLTLADIFTALGNGVGVVRVFLNDYSVNATHNPCDETVIWCNLQSFVTTTSSLSSFLWTGAIAVYYAVKVLLGNDQRRLLVMGMMEKMDIYFHMICVGIPVSLVGMAWSIGALGEDNSSTNAGWCWISGCRKHWTDNQMIALRLWTGKLWEIVLYVFVVIISFVIKHHIFLRNRHSLNSFSVTVSTILPGSSSAERLNVANRNAAIESATPRSSTANGQLLSLERTCIGDQRNVITRSDSISSSPNDDRSIIATEESLFFVMPWLLSFIRLPGTVRFIIWLCSIKYDVEPMEMTDTILLCLQGIGDSSQATVNNILFLIYSSNSRRYIKSNVKRTWRRLFPVHQQP